MPVISFEKVPKTEKQPQQPKPKQGSRIEKLLADDLKQIKLGAFAILSILLLGLDYYVANQWGALAGIVPMVAAIWSLVQFVLIFCDKK